MTETSTEAATGRASLGRYVGYFALIYAACIILFGVVGLFTDINLGRLGTFVPIIAAGMMTGSLFVGREGRSFIAGEKWPLAAYCLLAAYGVSLISGLVLFTATGELANLADLVASVPGLVWVVVLVILLPIQFGMTGLFLGVGAKSKAKTLPAQNVEKVFE